MQALEQTLISLFEQAAEKNTTLLQELEQEKCFALTPDRWCFTLPDLYSFLQQRVDLMNTVSYKEFRRAVYSATVNATIKRFAAEIVIDQNRGQVDESVYALTWWKREDEVPSPPTT